MQRNRGRRGRRGVAVVLAVAVALTACGDDDASPLPSATTTTTTSSTSSTTSTTVMGVPVEAERALLALADLPAGWARADEAVGEVDPATGFCDGFVSVRALDSVRTRPFSAAPSGPWLVSGVAVFDSDRAATTYLSAVDATLDCRRWNDGSGAEHRVDRVEVEDRGADEVRAYAQATDLADASFAVDIVYLRVDRAVSFLTWTRRVTEPSQDTPDGEGGAPLDLGAVVDAAAGRLHGAVRT